MAQAFPIEVWMLILESLDLKPALARPLYIQAYTKAVLSEATTEEDVVAEFPNFEKRAWRLTRRYYAINQVSRKAAQQTFLSGLLLQTCAAPVDDVPELRKPLAVRSTLSGRYKKNTDTKQRLHPDILATMQPIPGPDGLQPTYMALELYDIGAYDELCNNHLAVDGSLYEMTDRLCVPVYETELLRTVKTVELLIAAPVEDLEDAVVEAAEDARIWIEDRWEALGVTGGVIRMLQ